MNRYLVGCLLLLFLPFLAGAGELPVVQPEKVGMSSKKLQKVDEAVRKLIDQKKVAGAVVIVARKGQIVHYSAQGLRDIEQKKPMEKDTIVRIYSMTKLITTVAALMLVEEGKLELDDPVSKYLPEMKKLQVLVKEEGEKEKLVPARRQMTIRDLMRHTSGLTYGSGSKTLVDRLYQQQKVLDRDSSLQEMVARLGEIPLRCHPGERFEYGVSTDVLGRVIEVCSGIPLDEFLARRIFEPLDMRDTGFFVPEQKLARFAANYTPDEKTGLREYDAPATSPYRRRPGLLSGGGGLVSAARDYIRFLQMILDEGTFEGKQILKKETVQTMRQNHLPREALPLAMSGSVRPGSGFGLGMAVRLDRSREDPGAPVGECRWGGAASTHFWLSPRDELAVVILQQQMPFTPLLERTLKPLIYDSLVYTSGK